MLRLPKLPCVSEKQTNCSIKGKPNHTIFLPFILMKRIAVLFIARHFSKEVFSNTFFLLWFGLKVHTTKKKLTLASSSPNFFLPLSLYHKCTYQTIIIIKKKITASGPDQMNYYYFYPIMNLIGNLTLHYFICGL